jgi:hypothetical protein
MAREDRSPRIAQGMEIRISTKLVLVGDAISLGVYSQCSRLRDTAKNKV